MSKEYQSFKKKIEENDIANGIIWIEVDGIRYSLSCQDKYVKNGSRGHNSYKNYWKKDGWEKISKKKVPPEIMEVFNGKLKGISDLNPKKWTMKIKKLNEMVDDSIIRNNYIFNSCDDQFNTPPWDDQFNTLTPNDQGNLPPSFEQFKPLLSECQGNQTPDPEEHNETTPDSSYGSQDDLVFPEEFYVFDNFSEIDFG